MYMNTLNSKNAILISKEELKNKEETLFLSSIPGYVDNVNNIRKTENWCEAEEYSRDEEW